MFNALTFSRAEQGASFTAGPIFFLTRIPNIFLWALINTLAFHIDNQRQTSALKEGLFNKPWRLMPAGRLGAFQARCLVFVTYPLALLASIILGGETSECFLLMLFGCSYNDLHIGDSSWFLRNILNACGFTCVASGALEVALHSLIPHALLPWIFVVGAVVATTVHTQDMYDQSGDSAAG